LIVVLIFAAVVIGVVVGNALRRRVDHPDHTERSDSLDD
jgi:hypothetical protein